jgi:hypothetical protein
MYFPFLFVLAITAIFSVQHTSALCPICTVFVGGGLFISEKLGIDDFVAALWMGGLTVSMTLWTIDWLIRKQWNFAFFRSITWFSYILVLVLSLEFIKAFGKGFLFGVDKIILGNIIGAILFFIAALWYQAIKKNNNNKPWFPFQKVVWPVGALAIATAIAELFLLK